MTDKQINVLIVDDSAFMRRVITTMLESDSSLKVVSYARDGEDALVKIKRYNPDVVTMDVEMPGLDGLSALKLIMCENPVPVVMLSSLTTAGARQTIEALSLGAVDFVAKPANRQELPKLASELINTVKTAAQVSVKKVCSINGSILAKSSGPQPERPSPSVMVPKPVFLKPPKLGATTTIKTTSSIELVAVGTSTGGPTALQVLLTRIPKSLPCGIVVVQHMPKGFTGPLAKRLNDLCEIEVKEGEDGDMVLPGRAIIAPAGHQLTFTRRSGYLQISLSDHSPIKTLFKPSVDVMMLSAVETLGSKVLGVIMTGMGNDGLQGLKSLKKQKGLILAQNEETCIVYGMPKAVVDAGIADKVLPLDELGSEIVSIVAKNKYDI
ncbi:protein-glutamate methylesterase/protein-glutamine glutaminase [Desulfitibacter alkalitolerans]|uniref:protein-glutamate methylesterase/protein-glutamine glutaminase n=1 Tax=Desulfitibacter alkalitolerans TaxID=264641 RepID=UPI00048A3ABA|nr:chemotaxis response regulator protein-glutamate methylesterase [Desulfitibacter alkalitolerans]